MIRYLLPAVDIDMAGLRVKQALPTRKVQQVDPYLLLHHGEAQPNPDAPAKHQGVGPHPHRGFSPVTFVIEGAVHHRDSFGNDQVAKAGEVQWMHAGAGIVHSERPTEDLITSGAKQEVIQLWINSPAAKKMTAPTYQHLSEEAMMPWSMADGVRVKLVAGSYAGRTSATKTQSPLLILWVEMEAGSECSFDLPEGYNTSLYSIRGDLSVRSFGMIDARTLAVLEEGVTHLAVEAKTQNQFLLLSGEPIGEKVTQYGPYVMNTQTEIMEALRDYQMGKMGGLIED